LKRTESNILNDQARGERKISSHGFFCRSLILKVLKSDKPKSENRSMAGHIGPYSFCFLSLLVISYNLRRFFRSFTSLFRGSAHITASCLHQHQQKNAVASCVAVNNLECQAVIFSGSLSKNMLLLSHIDRFLFPCAGHLYQ
jgi:hypothetical protein